MAGREQVKMEERIARMQKLLEHAQLQLQAFNLPGVQFFAELLSEQADTLVEEAKAAK